MPTNPFKPGAGHMPPYLAGRDDEQNEFEKALDQEVVLENVVLTGLRGVGKTVLSDKFKPMAQQKDWLWAGSDLSETSSVSEERMCLRIITDLAIAVSSITIERVKPPALLNPMEQTEKSSLSFEDLVQIYEDTPGMPSDKLRSVLEQTWPHIETSSFRGVVFAYDEAQNLSDKSDKNEYPLSMLLDVFQSIQKRGMRFMLLLVGLPTLFPKLVEARTFSERMFHIVTLDKLKPDEARKAIEVPIRDKAPDMNITSDSVDLIVKTSGGYPYFIQFICKEVFDVFLLQAEKEEPLFVPITAIISKLDSDFFAARWSRVTDRQRVLLWVAAHLPTCDSEFTVQEVVTKSQELHVKEFSNSTANQTLAGLCKAGLVYKTPRHGKYQFAVPLLPDFIKRQESDIEFQAQAQS